MSPRWMTLARVLLCALAVLAAVPAERSPAAAVPVPVSRDGVASLKDQLESGLKARQPQEFAFIARVVAMVEIGQLPYDLVQSTFMWARKKRPYPFPYFRRALHIRAQERGIKL